MITIIPTLEVMKAVVDNNVQSGSSGLRRIAFDIATDLMSQCDVDILIEGILFDRLKSKLNADHQTYFTSVYRIDNSAKGLTEYNVHEAIKWVAKSESNSRKVIILSEQDTPFNNVCCDNIICLSPSKFIDSVERATKLNDRKAFSTLDDALTAVLFLFKS
jgi:hypothetical protein